MFTKTAKKTLWSAKEKINYFYKMFEEMFYKDRSWNREERKKRLSLLWIIAQVEKSSWTRIFPYQFPHLFLSILFHLENVTRVVNPTRNNSKKNRWRKHEWVTNNTEFNTFTLPKMWWSLLNWKPSSKQSLINFIYWKTSHFP